LGQFLNFRKLERNINSKTQVRRVLRIWQPKQKLLLSSMLNIFVTQLQDNTAYM